MSVIPKPSPDSETCNLSFTNTTNDTNNLPSSIRAHFEPGKVICEPLNLLTETMTILSICDRLPELGIGGLVFEFCIFFI